MQHGTGRACDVAAGVKRCQDGVAGDGAGEVAAGLDEGEGAIAGGDVGADIDGGLNLRVIHAHHAMGRRDRSADGPIALQTAAPLHARSKSYGARRKFRSKALPRSKTGAPAARRALVQHGRVRTFRPTHADRLSHIHLWIRLPPRLNSAIMIFYALQGLGPLQKLVEDRVIAQAGLGSEPEVRGSRACALLEDLLIERLGEIVERSGLFCTTN